MIAHSLIDRSLLIVRSHLIDRSFVNWCEVDTTSSLPPFLIAVSFLPTLSVLPPPSYIVPLFTR
jgi:hypothetical protein